MNPHCGLFQSYRRRDYPPHWKLETANNLEIAFLFLCWTRFSCNLLIAGYIGADCSILADSPPVVRQLVSEGMCQTRTSKCNSARFIVENFDILSSVVCRLVRFVLREFFRLNSLANDLISQNHDLCIKGFRLGCNNWRTGERVHVKFCYLSPDFTQLNLYTVQTVDREQSI